MQLVVAVFCTTKWYSFVYKLALSRIFQPLIINTNSLTKTISKEFETILLLSLLKSINTIWLPVASMTVI